MLKPQRNLRASSEGVDGPWSSFELRVGSPAQNLRILPGTSSTQTLVVLQEGCQIIKVNDCANSRGELFNTTASHTWKEIGLFELGFENSLGFTDNGEFGYDTGKATFCLSITLHAHIDAKFQSGSGILAVVALLSTTPSLLVLQAQSFIWECLR